jgi:hypothetical protein
MLRQALGLCLLVALGAVMWNVLPPEWRPLSGAHDSSTEDGLGNGAATNSAASVESTEPPLRVLFMGNSHTHYNAMPRMIAELARAVDERPLEFAMETPGGQTLQGHLASGRLQVQLSAVRYDYVVLQDQQQRPAFRSNMTQLEEIFVAPARELDRQTRAAGAKTLLYMTAARRAGDPDNVPGDSYEDMQDRVRDSYESLGRELEARVVPVGVAYRWAHEQRPELALWNPDGSHPSRLGSYLTACAFYSALYARSPDGNPYLAGLPEDDARFAQRAAHVASRLSE